MILTCPACGTQYVVKDGAIPPQGRQVRCASCKHSWHQDPEQRDFDDDGETLAEAAVIEPRSGPEAEERAFQAAALADQPIPDVAEEAAGRDEADVEPIESVEPSESVEPVEPIEPEQAPAAEADAHDGAIADEQAVNQDWTGTPAEPTYDDEFSPFAAREPEPRRRSPLLTILIIAVLTAAAAAAFWFLAPPEWKQRIGIAGAGETPLQLMMTHSDRQKLASGNELLAVSGRVINPTDESQNVPPIQAQLRSTSGKLVYSWTIAPPARTLPPGASATFNSAEVNVPAGGDELTITLGSAKS
jgi:predicted Zn finger-like uncharacterized protein